MKLSDCLSLCVEVRVNGSVVRIPGPTLVDGIPLTNFIARLRGLASALETSISEAEHGINSWSIGFVKDSEAVMGNDSGRVITLT